MTNRTAPIVALALLSAVGIGGMLLANGAADGGFFVLAALPLAVGGARAWVHRDAGRAH